MICTEEQETELIHNHDEVMIIDWVNSLDIPSCTLADDIHDLKSGCVVADIVSHLFSISLPKIQRNINSRQDAIFNWTLILEKLQDQVPIKYLSKPDEFLDKSDKLLVLLDYLSTVKKEPQVPKPVKASLIKPVFAAPVVHSSASPAPPRPFQETPNKIPEQTKYEPRPIPEMLKESLVDWLEKLHIIKKDAQSLHLIPSICRTGVLICDLVNRVGGRLETIKGIERNPKNRTQALANINKALEFLRGLPKISSKHLWSNKEIIEGDEDVIWGLLDDIRSVFAAPASTAKPKPAPQPSAPNITLPAIPVQEKIMLPKTMAKEQTHKSLRSYSSSMKKFSSKSSSRNTTRLTRPPSSRSIKSDTIKSSHFFISQEMKKNVFAWVEALGIEYEPNANPYLDVLKNGLLVCELIRVLEGQSIRINSNPRTTQAVYENFDKALSVFKLKNSGIPCSAINDPESMIENSEVVYTFLYSLMTTYSAAAPVEYQPSLLPYGAIGIRKLEITVVLWVESLDILQPPPQFFSDIVPELKKGVLLCVITSKVTAVKIFNIVPEPKTEQSAMNNIRKSLDVLRKLPRMSQKFTWSEKEIYKGNYSVLLGLLEDLLRWSDGLPARKNGDEYHKDGPYLRPEEKNRKNEETFNTTFGSSHSPKNSEKPETANLDLEEIDPYVQWLNSVGADFPRTLRFKDDHIPEFTTGVLICGIVSSLEKIKLTGVEKEPRTRASAIQNINKALNVLKKKPGFPKELSQSAEEIFLGNGVVIRKLMQEIMGIYMNKARRE